MRNVNIGLLGCGTVGQGILRCLESERTRIEARFGVSLHVRKVLVRDLEKMRQGVATRSLTRSAVEVIDDDVDVVVEVIGGIDCAGAYLRRAIDRGHHVVTANKALLAQQGPELFALAGQRGVEIGFEASVCGGLPVLGALRRGLAADRVDRLEGIVNGTTNFILTMMEENDVELPVALAAARAAGFAEPDATLDLNGTDAVQKMQILAAVAFEEPHELVQVQGMENIARKDLHGAASRGRVVRLIASAERRGGRVEIRVGPCEMERSNPFAAIRGEMNALRVLTRACGDLLFAGRGAGGGPTASAVVSDIIQIVGGQGRTPARWSRDRTGHHIPSSPVVDLT